MSYAKSFAQSKIGDVGISDELLSMRDEYPTLLDVLLGVPAQGEDQPAVPSASVLLFVEGGEIRFCIKPKSGPLVAFGRLPDPSKGFQGLEEELANGRIGWKKSRPR